MKAAMQRRVEEAVAETEAKAGGLRDAREKNVHFSARVVALNARAAQQQKDLRSLTAINAALTQELEELRSHRSRAGDVPQLENGESLIVSYLAHRARHHCMLLLALVILPLFQLGHKQAIVSTSCSLTKSGEGRLMSAWSCSLYRGTFAVSSLSSTAVMYCPS